MSTKKRKPIKFEEGSGNVFADLGLKDADQLLARSQIGFHLFKILEDKKEQAILQFSSEDAPISVGIVFDCSGSMGP